MKPRECDHEKPWLPTGEKSWMIVTPRTVIETNVMACEQCGMKFHEPIEGGKERPLTEEELENLNIVPAELLEE